ncbi:MAG: DUF1127 domain-containing protein [Phaeospirillum sp.]|nr:DUF1127 domain-containing protein [Phaeospirillum sp.]
MSLSPTFGLRAQHLGLGQAVVGFVMDRIVHPLEIVAARRALRAELDGLDHRELRDLGINEAAVDGFVSTWRPSRTR